MGFILLLCASVFRSDVSNPPAAGRASIFAGSRLSPAGILLRVIR